jgi:alkaline phosphatase D
VSRISLFIIVLWIIELTSCKSTTRIAFGSCGYQDQAQPVLTLAASYKPDAFIFLGDNIYGDTDDMDTLRAKYSRWQRQTHYQNLKNSTQIFATWDDHDYGRNDSGREYPYKAISKDIFMKAFGIGAQSAMRTREGIYDSHILEQGRHRIQIILLDVRTFRSSDVDYTPGAKLPRDQYFYTPDYAIQTHPDSTMLGEAQWKWLEGELRKPADLRLICSGTQFGIEFNGYEAWANFPHEQRRMFDLIRTTRAEGALFLTGDVHYGEISRQSVDGLYPIYDVTSSGITSTWDFSTCNMHRIEGPVMENHFGLLTIDWQRSPRVHMRIIDHTDNERILYTIPLTSLKF